MEARATVIIPTFGKASFARWAIKSVQQQTEKDIEICLVCDGSPEHMVSLFENMQKDDPRIRIFVFPKSLRTGEPYRDTAIKKTTGTIICYCCHDDLWLPYHIQEMEKSLKSCFFTHSWHAFINPPGFIKDEKSLFGGIHRMDLKNRYYVKKMLNGKNFFGLTFGAHTRKSYDNLEEGWVTTPLENIPTDLYMWQKFLSAYENHCRTIKKVTALNFRKYDRKGWSESERNDELKSYFEKIQDPKFLEKIDRLTTAYHRTPIRRIKKFFYKKFYK